MSHIDMIHFQLQENARKARKAFRPARKLAQSTLKGMSKERLANHLHAYAKTICGDEIAEFSLGECGWLGIRGDACKSFGHGFRVMYANRKELTQMIDYLYNKS